MILQASACRGHPFTESIPFPIPPTWKLELSITSILPCSFPSYLWKRTLHSTRLATVIFKLNNLHIFPSQSQVGEVLFFIIIISLSFQVDYFPASFTTISILIASSLYAFLLYYILNYLLIISFKSFSLLLQKMQHQFPAVSRIFQLSVYRYNQPKACPISLLHTG